MAISFQDRKPRVRKAGAPVPEFKGIKVPSFELTTLADVDGLIEYFKGVGATDAVKFLTDKTAKFRA